MSTTQATIPLIYIPDHKDRALRMMPSQFRNDKPTMEAFVKALAEGVQTLEDIYFDIITGTRLCFATGANLDIWGDLVGEVRGDLNDIDYRRFIEARVLVNKSSGKTDDLIKIAQLITAESTVREQAFFPAEVIIYVFRSSAMSDAVAERVGVTMNDARPAGIKLQVIEAIDGYLGFSDNPDSTPMPIGLLARNIL